MSPIPWTAILTHGPALVSAATRLLATSQKKNPTSQPLEARLDQLQTASMESARVIQQLAQQVQALASAQEQTARRVRVAMALGVVVVIVGIGAGILAVVM
jgi:hypothetical protein